MMISIYILCHSNCTVTAILVSVTSILFWFFTLLLVIRNNQDSFYYMKQADKFLKSMITRDPILLDKRGITSMFGRSQYEL